MTEPNELLNLARDAHGNAENYPDTKMTYWRIRNLYIDTLAHTLDIEYDTAYQMVLDPDFKLPKKKKYKN
jgi:hypothetical protein